MTTVKFSAATWVKGTPGHTRQAVAQGKSQLAYKMSSFAAKAMAATAVALIDSPDILGRAWEELLARTGGGKYVCPSPDGVRPRALGSIAHENR